MLLKYKRFTFVLLILFFSSSQAAHAFIIESYELPLIIDTSVGSYEMSTIFGSYESERAILESQPWWNNITLTEEFTTLTGLLLGLPNPTSFQGTPFIGPFFTYGLSEFSFGGGRFKGCVLQTNVVCFNPEVFGPGALVPTDSNFEFTFAIATPITTESVPEPTTGLLFGISLMMLIFSSRKKKALNQI
jgi:hypothetical protein